MKVIFSILIFLAFLIFSAASANAIANEGLDKIAFVSTISGNWDLWIMNSDGSGLTQLTDTPIDERCPSISADGKRIAYSTNDGKLWTVNVDGTGANEITLRENGIHTHPSWSPDGKSIVFTAFSKTGIDDSDIWIVDSDGKNPRRLTLQNEIQINPAWSSDGKSIIYSSTVYSQSYEILHDLWLIRPDGQGEKMLLANHTANIQPDFSPDGRKIAFASNKTGNMEIWIMDSDGKNLRQLTYDDAYDADPCWSGGGKYIVFVSNRSGNLQLWLMGANGENLKQLTREGESKDPDWR